MNNKTKYWVWLSLIVSPGTETQNILGAFPDPEELYKLSPEKRLEAKVFTAGQKAKLNKVELSEAEEIIEICKKNGWNICTPADDDFPENLKRIRKMPLVLYVDGDLSRIKDKISIGVVGTRQPSRESVCVARTIAGDLAYAGAAVISGGALGIDSAAHEGALDSDGVTVSVLGCGLGTRYLSRNEATRKRIRETGAVISEFRPFTSASRFTFPIRNRIVAGISHGILVVEAGEKSGSLITANDARQQGREVFAIPGSVLDSSYTGANRLIRDGAKAVMSARDILSPYAAMYPDIIDLSRIRETEPVLEEPEEEKPVKIKKEAPADLDPDQLTVYNLFGDKPLYADDIIEQSGLRVPKVIASLMRLEMLDLIEQTDGKAYILK